MKKQFLFLVMGLIASGLFANGYVIDTDKLPAGIFNEANQLELVGWENEIDVLVKMDDAEAERRLETIRSELGIVYRQISSGNHASSEALFLQSLLALDLFRAGDSSYGPVFEVDIERAHRTLATDYRFHWYRGLYYFYQGNLEFSIRYFDEVALSVPYRNLAPWFWEDYAVTAFMAAMPEYARMALSYYESITGMPSALESSMGAVLEENFAPYDGEELVWDEVWFPQKRGERLLLQNRIFGMNVYLSDDWETFPRTIIDNSVTLIMRMPVVADQDGGPFYTIQVASFAQGSMTFDEFIEGSMAGHGDFSLAVPFYLGDETRAFEVEETDASGAVVKTYCLFFRQSEPEVAGIELEAPSVLPDGTSAADYYWENPLYSRLDGTLYYRILMQAPEAYYVSGIDELLHLLQDRFDLDS